MSDDMGKTANTVMPKLRYFTRRVAKSHKKAASAGQSLHLMNTSIFQGTNYFFFKKITLYVCLDTA
jgi:hypothetical protein